MARMKKLVLAALLASVSVVGLVACEDDDDHGTHVTPVECEPIAEGCHDSPGAEAQECHENAEGVWTAAECTANSEACLALCGTGGGVDAGAVDTATAGR
jgi:hypothetical protein